MMHKIEKEGVLLSPEEEIAANQNKIIMEDTRRNAIQRLKSDLIIKITGVRGRSICIYPYKCVINTSITAGSVLTGNAIDGEKTIYFKDVIGIQYKKPGKLIGYLQFETAAMTMNNEKSNFFNENTFTFDKGTEEVTQAAYEYVIGRMDALKAIE